ncbi:MAG: ABC transporter permease subunit [Chloroflexota bacterium]|nr:ABC transporter permease subunit [Chloroflexota bacterium]
MQPQGELFDIGYQRYDGPREGRPRARRTIFEDGMRTILGIGRGGRAKILPALLFLSAIIPALIFVLILSFAEPAADFLPGPADYYSVISFLMLIFAAISAPELLVSDRRNNVIYLYLVRPLTVNDYLLGRFLAFFVLVTALAYSGQIILQVGIILTASDPVQHLQDEWTDIPRFLFAGLVVALFITALPMAAAAFTYRRAYAAIIVIGLFFISAGVADALTSPVGTCTTTTEVDAEGNVSTETVCDEEGAITGDAAKWYALISLRDVPLRVNDMIFDIAVNDEEGPPSIIVGQELPAIVPIAVYLFFTAGPLGLLWLRYRRIRA